MLLPIAGPHGPHSEGVGEVQGAVQAKVRAVAYSIVSLMYR